MTIRPVVRTMLLLLVIVGFQFQTSARAQDGKNTEKNAAEESQECLVMPGRKADPRHSLVYKSKTYFFCCEECVADFRATPEHYLSRPLVPEPTGLSFYDLTAMASANSLPLSGLALSSLMLFIAMVWWRRRGSPPVWLLLLVGIPVVMALMEQVRRERVLRLVAEERVLKKEVNEIFNYAVTHDYGYPPRPSKPPLPPRMEGTFYRGNDERTPQLSNGGNYRTCTFNVRIIQSDNGRLEHEKKVNSGSISVELDIVRALHTAEGFWSPSLMGTIFLTRHPEQIDSPRSTSGRIHLTVVEPRQRFTAKYPIGRISGVGIERIAGIVYVCEALKINRLTGARFHYAIQYDLTVREGIVQKNSDVWMGSLYRTSRISVTKLPLSEWFSHEPIPELTAPQKLVSPKALGLTDYEEKLGPSPRPPQVE